MLIQIVEPTEIHSQALALLKKNGHQLIIDEPTLAQIKTLEAIFIRTYTQANRSFLEKYPNLKYLLRAGVGLDNIDLNYCKSQKITVINSPGANANAVAEMVIALATLLLRNFAPQNYLLTKKKWRERNLIGFEIKNKTIGLVGCGAIGKLVSKKLANYEVKQILGFDPFLNQEELIKYGIIKTELEDLINKADIISLHLPLNKQTINLFSLPQLKKMKKTASIINTSRGGIINETDLISDLGFSQKEVFVNSYINFAKHNRRLHILFSEIAKKI